MSINDSLNYSASVSCSEWFTTIMAILEVIGMWFYFEKAGEHGWKALIPFYNIYIDCTVAKRKNIFVMRLIAVIMQYIATVMVVLGSVVALVGFSATGSYETSAIFLIGALLLAVSFVLSLISGWKISRGLAENFGLTTAFAVGLLLLPGIFKMILGLGKYTYQKDDNVIDAEVNETDTASDPM